MEGNLTMEMECPFCCAPLRLRDGAGNDRNGKDMEHYYPCSRCVDERPDILGRYTLQEALKQERRLQTLMLGAAGLPEASIFACRGADFPAIVPKSLQSYGLCVVRLPGFVQPRLEELAATGLLGTTRHNVDLSSASTHMRWDMPDLAINFPMAGFECLFSLDGDEPCVLFLFVSAGTVILSSYPIDESFMGCLQACGMSEGESYPDRAWTDQELENEAREEQFEEPCFALVLDDGTIDIELHGYVCRR